MFWSVQPGGGSASSSWAVQPGQQSLKLPACRQALAGGTTRSPLVSKRSSPRSSLTHVEAAQAAAALHPQVSHVTALAADKSAASGSKLDAYLDSLGLEPKNGAGLQSTTRSRLGQSPQQQAGQSAAQQHTRSSSAADQRSSSGSGAPPPPLQHGQAGSRLSSDGHQQPVTGRAALQWSKSSTAAALLDAAPVQRVQYRWALLSQLLLIDMHVPQACPWPAVLMNAHHPHMAFLLSSQGNIHLSHAHAVPRET